MRIGASRMLIKVEVDQRRLVASHSLKFERWRTRLIVDVIILRICCRIIGQSGDKEVIVLRVCCRRRLCLCLCLLRFLSFALLLRTLYWTIDHFFK